MSVSAGKELIQADFTGANKNAYVQKRRTHELRQSLTINLELIIMDQQQIVVIAVAQAANAVPVILLKHRALVCMHECAYLAVSKFVSLGRKLSNKVGSYRLRCLLDGG